MNRHFMRAVVGMAILVGLLGTSACFRHHTPAERADWVRWTEQNPWNKMDSAE